jgi:ketosteroid isomerase-like protein
MTAEENRAIVIDAWKAFSSRDAQKIAAFFTPDAEWTAPPDNATAQVLGAPSGFTGNDAIARFIAVDFGKVFRDVQIDFRGVHAGGSVVVVENRLRATLEGGALYDNDYCFVFEMKDGLIHRMREYMDTAKGHRMIFGEGAQPRPNIERSNRQSVAGEMG